MFNTVTSAFIDEFDFLKSRKILLTATVCVAEFLLGVPCVTRGGIYYLQVMDWYCATFSLMILSFCELMVIAWVYGVNRFYKDMQLMLGFTPCAYWKYMWSYVTPALIMFVLGFSIVIHSPVTYGDYNYPGWAIGIGWIFALASLVPVPILAIIGYNKIQTGSFFQRVKKAARPNAEWGPALDEDRLRYYQSLKAEGSDFVTEEMLECLARPHVILHKAIDLNSTLNLKNISQLNLRQGSSLQNLPDLQEIKENAIV